MRNADVRHSATDLILKQRNSRIDTLFPACSESEVKWTTSKNATRGDEAGGSQDAPFMKLCSSQDMPYSRRD